ncbi:hypothetical protein GCM10018966_042460 [Streptomyces yanii]
MSRGNGEEFHEGARARPGPALGKWRASVAFYPEPAEKVYTQQRGYVRGVLAVAGGARCVHQAVTVTAVPGQPEDPRATVREGLRGRSLRGPRVRTG